MQLSFHFRRFSSVFRRLAGLTSFVDDDAGAASNSLLLTLQKYLNKDISIFKTKVKRLYAKINLISILS